MTKKDMKFMTISWLIAIVVMTVVSLIAPPAHAQNNFVIPADVPGRFATMIRPAPTYVQAQVLAANVSETMTLPADTRLAIFSANCNFHAKPGGSAAVPVADVTDGTASEMNPAAWYFTNAAGATQTVTLIAATVCIVTVSAYKGKLQ